jgi:hypothetical protein
MRPVAMFSRVLPLVLCPLLIAASLIAQTQGAKPSVVSTAPADKSVGVSRLRPCLTFTFNKEMAPWCGAITQNWYAGGPGSTCTWSADKKTMTVCREDPPTRLGLGKTITAWLNPAGSTPWIQDEAGNFLDPYSISFKIEEGTSELIEVPADPAKGFSWPYFLYKPDAIREPAVLLVEPSNTGTVNDSFAVHEAAAGAQIRSRTSWADDLGAPYLVPTFPRPATRDSSRVTRASRNRATASHWPPAQAQRPAGSQNWKGTVGPGSHL